MSAVSRVAALHEERLRRGQACDVVTLGPAQASEFCEFLAACYSRPFTFVDLAQWKVWGMQVVIEDATNQVTISGATT